MSKTVSYSQMVQSPENGEQGDAWSSPKFAKFQRHSTLLWLSAVLNIILVAIISSNVAFEKMSLHQHTHVDLPYSPANHIVQYELRDVLVDPTQDQSDFAGPPGDNYDLQWHQLLNGTFLKLTDEELAKAGSSSLPMEGGGYGAGLGVAHNLHCVKRVKEWVYADHFYPDLEAGSERYNKLQHHADHCLDSLRKSILCHVDFSLYTLWWGPNGHAKPAIREVGPQRCVNWNLLQGWMKSRAASQDLLLHERS